VRGPDRFLRLNETVKPKYADGSAVDRNGLAGSKDVGEIADTLHVAKAIQVFECRLELEETPAGGGEDVDADGARFGEREGDVGVPAPRSSAAGWGRTFPWEALMALVTTKGCSWVRMDNTKVRRAISHRKIGWPRCAGALAAGMGLDPAPGGGRDRYYGARGPAGVAVIEAARVAEIGPGQLLGVSEVARKHLFD